MTVFERRTDPRIRMAQGKVGEGRSINLALSTRGLNALSKLDLEQFAALSAAQVDFLQHIYLDFSESDGLEIKEIEKSSDELKNIALDDYKIYIENQWNEELKKKYKVEINESVFESIFTN